MSDKRSVTTDALATLGTLIDETAGRDAIHLAVEPVVAGEQLFAGQHVGIENGVATTKAKTKFGIVDPFVVGSIPKGARFWFIVYPRKITSLRHVWEYDAFDKTLIKEKTPMERAEEWIKDFAQGISLPYDTLMNGADDYIDSQDYLCFGGLLEGESVPEEFWDKYEIIRGIKVHPNKRGTFFSCSC